MKKIYQSLLTLSLAALLQNSSYAQCASSATLGASSNMFTLIRNGTNPIAADKNLNTIVYAHRNNAAAFGGSSGNIRYSISTNAGATFTNNLGVLNPLLTSPARYPNATIYNPVNNTNPSNAYVGYLAATVSSTNSAWNGQVTGVRQLNGAGNTESYNQASATNTNVLIPQSMVKGAPGVFWAVDAVFNGTLTTGYRIYKGTWGTTDISWTTNFTALPPLSTALNGTASVGDYNIAFDPTGNFGWMSFLGHLNTGPTNYAFYPIFYKTIDGGNTWTGPIQVDLNQFNCATSILTSPNVISTAFEHDLTVDINGNPHMLTTLCNGNNAYAVYFSSIHRMFDITQLNGVWNAYEIANVNAGRGTWGIAPNSVTMDMQPQIARSSDGRKIFFNWTDNSTYTLGQANQTPNLKSRAFDVTTNNWTLVKDFTACNIGLNGLILFPHVAAEVLEPTLTSYKMASVYAEFTVPNDPLTITNFKFLDNTIYNVSDFTVAQPTATATIVQGNNLLLCPTSSASLNIVGTYTQVLWSNGATTNSTSINAPGNYIVTVRNGCTLGADTIAVTSLTANLTPTVSTICNGSSSTLSVTSNALSYTWSPSNATTPTISVSPTTTSVYTITASGNNCTYPQTATVNVNAVPVVTASITNSVICSGFTTAVNGSGASTYTWTGGVTNAIPFSPTATASYSLTGTSAAGCTSTNTAVQSVTVNSLPTVSIAPSASVVCFGQTTTLTASGANTYSWNTTATTPAITVTLNISTSYNVVGTSTNGCTNTGSVTVLVTTCTGIDNLSSNIQDLSFQVYPNPSNGEFTISTDTDMNLSIINNLGQVVKEISINSSNNYNASVSNLANGIYFVVGKNNDQLIKTKIIVSK
jgi:hypothetical protein